MSVDIGPYYFTNVYLDILDDFECLWTIYSFASKDIAERFIEEVPFVCSDIEYTERVREDDGHTDKYPYRPIFSTLEDALADAKEFYKYWNNTEYKYHGRVFRVDLDVIEKQHDKNTIKKLSKEVAELKGKLAVFEEKLSLNANHP